MQEVQNTNDTDVEMAGVETKEQRVDGTQKTESESREEEAEEPDKNGMVASSSHDTVGTQASNQSEFGVTCT